MYWLTSPNGRVAEWAMNDGTRKAPLVFATREMAIKWRDTVAKNRRMKPKQCDKPDPCWTWDGEYCWQGSLSTDEMEGVREDHICHEQLDPESEQVCRDLYGCIGHVIEPSFEKWELSFLRDAHPERELEVWQTIAEAYRTYIAEHRDCNQRVAVNSFVAISMGAENEALDEYRPYYHGTLKPLVLSPDERRVEVQTTISNELLAVMPRDEIRKLLHKWTEKAIDNGLKNAVVFGLPSTFTCSFVRLLKPSL